MILAEHSIRIAIAALAGLAIIAVAREVITGYKISRLERTSAAHAAKAVEAEERAAHATLQASAGLRKIESLENELAALSEHARRKDEEINKKSDAVRTHRRLRDDARRVGPVDVSVEDLCKKLAALGYECK